MARHWFGGTVTDWSFQLATAVDASDDPVPDLVQAVGDATLTFWNLESGGTQYTDLLVNSAAADHVVTDDGTTRQVGAIPPFQGPDEVWWMWADGGAGSRYVMFAWDFGDRLAELGSLVAANTSSLSVHLSAANPHATPLSSLTDVSVGGATEGQVLSRVGGLWVATSIAGLTDVVDLESEQTITGRKYFQNPTGGAGGTQDDSAIVVLANTGQVADVMQFRNASNQRTTYMNEHGELRVIASQDNTVPARFKGRSAGQTANLTEWTDIGNNPLAWITADGRLVAVNTMFAPWVMSVSGDQVTVGQGVARVYNDTGSTLTIRSVRATAGVAPTGDDIIIDINKDGTSILTSELVIPDGSHTTGRVTALAVTTIANGEYLTVDIDQLGSTEPGDHIVVQLQVA